MQTRPAFSRSAPAAHGTAPGGWYRFAQTEPDDKPRFRVETEVVLLNVSVTDASGAPVTTLEGNDFLVLEDGDPQQLVYFQRQFRDEPTPSSVVLLVDASSSMEGEPLRQAKRAASEFINNRPPAAQVAVMSFDQVSRVACGFSEDPMSVASAVDQLVAVGGTALYDALLAAIEALESASNRRRVLVLLNDGKDLDSVASFSSVNEAVSKSAVSVYCVGQYSKRDRELFMTGEKYYKKPNLDVNLNPVWMLRHLAKLSGGMSFFPAPGEEVAPFFAGIARDLRHQYVLGYLLPPVTKGSGFHVVEVRVHPKSHPGPLVVRTRRGYVR